MGYEMLGEFESLMRHYGLEPDMISTDREIRRCFVAGDRRGSRNGWYILNSGARSMWGSFGSNKTGLKIDWRSDAEATTSYSCPPPITDLVLAVPVDFDQIWATANEADPLHPYLQSKGVARHGIRQRGPDLLIPARLFDGRLMGIQRVRVGQKGFLKGSQMRGAMHVLGDVGPQILVAEGYATAASVFEKTGICIIVAFSCGSLIHVGRALRCWQPDAQVVFMADEDDATANHAGQLAAESAAMEIDGHVLLPSQVFGKDFNHG